MEFINNQRFAELAGVDYNSTEIKPGPIVYSRTHEIVRQFPKLSTFPPCILITSFSDACVTDAMADKLPKNVKTWYSNNVMTTHPLVVPIPIGIRYSMQNEQILREVMESPRPETEALCYVNFLIYKKGNVNGNAARQGLYEKFQDKGWITIEGGATHIPMRDYYESIKRHRFVVSPPGAGPDCHRHWEALYLGSIPIVLRSRAMEDVLVGMPCLMVDNWDEVTVMELKTMTSCKEYPCMKKIDMSYWRRRIITDAKIL